MSLKVRKFNAQVRDSTTGQMVPAGLLSSDALSVIEDAKDDAIDAIEARAEEIEQNWPDDYSALSDSVDELRTQVEQVGECKIKTFNVTAETTHNHGADAIAVNFAARTPFLVFVSGVSKYQIYAYYSQNSYIKISTDSPFYGALENDVIFIGVYIAGNTITENSTVTVKAFEADSLFGAVGVNTININNLTKLTAPIGECYSTSFNVTAGVTHDASTHKVVINIPTGTPFCACVDGVSKYQIFAYQDANNRTKISTNATFYGTLADDIVAIGVFIDGETITNNATVTLKAFEADTLLGDVEVNKINVDNLNNSVENLNNSVENLTEYTAPIGECYSNSFNVTAGTTHIVDNDKMLVNIPAGTPFYAYVTGVSKYHIYAFYSDNSNTQISIDAPYYGTPAKNVVAIGVYILGNWIPSDSVIKVRAFTEDTLYGWVASIDERLKETEPLGRWYGNSFNVTTGTTHEYRSNVLPVNIPAGEEFSVYVTGNARYQIYAIHSEISATRIAIDAPYSGSLANDVVEIGVFIDGEWISSNKTITTEAFTNSSVYERLKNLENRETNIEDKTNPLGYWYGNSFNVTTGTVHNYTSNVLPVNIPSGEEFSVYVFGNTQYHIFAKYSNGSYVKIAENTTYSGSLANDVVGIGIYIAGEWITSNKTITTEVFTNDSIYKRLNDLETNETNVDNDITQINNQIDELETEIETNTGEIVDSNIYGYDSGYAAYFSDGAEDHKLLGLKCNLPYRNVSGVGWGSIIVRQITGTNLIAPLNPSATITGVTFTVNSDGTISTSGTATAYTTFTISNLIPFKAGIAYELSGCPSGGSDSSYRMSLGGSHAFDYGSRGIFIPECDINSDVRIIVSNGTNMDGKTFKPMVRYAYQPGKEYGENIIRITGRSRNAFNGLNFAVNPDGTIFVTGQANAYTEFYVQTGLALTAGKTYHLSGTPATGGSDSTFRMSIGETEAIDTGSGANYTPESDMTTDIKIIINSGATMDRRVFTPKLSVISKPPVEDFEKATVVTKSIGFPVNIYGGWVDMLNGKVTATLAQDGSALATPVTYNTSNVVPIEFTVSKGDNTFYTTDRCPVEVKYLKDQKIVSERAKNIDLLETYKKYDETVVINNVLNVGIPILYLVGDTTAMTKEVEANLDWVYKNMSGKCTLKWQGSSSLAYSKKNYTIKFANKVNFGKGWGAQKKYNLKANYIDFSHARNVVSGKLWGRIVKSRTTQNSYLYDLPNGGAVDGFPVIVALNGEYHGLYTMNIPKDEWMFGMTGSAQYEGILSAEDHTDPTKFKATVTKEALEQETSFSAEYAHSPDEDDVGWMATSVSQAISTVITALDSNPSHSEAAAAAAAAVGQYIDLDSVIDHYIFTCLIGATDCTDKNYLLVAFDNTKWYMSEWDMDTTYGNNWTGGGYLSAETQPTFASYADLSNLMKYIYTYKRTELIQRYDKLRNGEVVNGVHVPGIMSVDSVTSAFYNFCASIPKAIKDLDYKKYPLIPATDTNTVAQIANWYRMRCEVLDAEINALRPNSNSGNNQGS